MSKKSAILLVNLGTPVHNDKRSIKQFLKQFLSDKRVVDLPRWFWLPLLHFIILPLRLKKSTMAYQKIWTENGSPLRLYTQQLSTKLDKLPLTKSVQCDFAMTYGTPSIADKMRHLMDSGVTDVTIIPLYPQYSVSTSAPVFDQVGDYVKTTFNFPSIHFIHDYHDNPLYIDALCKSIKAQWAQHGQAEKLIFSYHGIPKRFVSKGDPYEKQCERTTALVVAQLGLNPAQYLLAYQSRFGREQWLMPYVDVELLSAVDSGCTSVDVICPAFSTDCLETLEEMLIENKKLFMDAGGQQFNYIACLNDNDSHVALMAALAGLR